MADAILVIENDPRPDPDGVYRNTSEMTVGLLFVYDLASGGEQVREFDTSVVPVTPSSSLPGFAGRHLDATTLEAFDSGDAAWDYFAMERPLGESLATTVQRAWQQFYPQRRQRLAFWRAQYQFTGRTLPVIAEEDL